MNQLTLSLWGVLISNGAVLITLVGLAWKLAATLARFETKIELLMDDYKIRQQHGD